MYTYTRERDNAEGTFALASVWLLVTINNMVSNDNYPFQLQELWHKRKFNVMMTTAFGIKAIL